jgi:hypothetical protein
MMVESLINKIAVITCNIEQNLSIILRKGLPTIKDLFSLYKSGKRPIIAIGPRNQLRWSTDHKLLL